VFSEMHNLPLRAEATDRDVPALHRGSSWYLRPGTTPLTGALIGKFYPSVCCRMDSAARLL